jgi:hypothetical protein
MWALQRRRQQQQWLHGGADDEGTGCGAGPQFEVVALILN